MSAHAASRNRRRSRPVALDGNGRILELLASYPHVSTSEAREILQYLKRAKYVEIESLRSDASVRHQLDTFIRANSHELAFSATELVIVLCLVVAFLSTCWLLWQAV